MNTTQCPTDENALILSQITLGPHIGVTYIGVAISSMVYGITCIQSFQYYRSRRSATDTLFLRITVSGSGCSSRYPEHPQFGDSTVSPKLGHDTLVSHVPAAYCDIFMTCGIVRVRLLDTAHQALVIHVMYYALVQHYEDASALLRTVWSIPTQVMVNAVIACIVEAIFVMRIWKFGRSIFVTGTCMAFALAHFGMFVGYCIKIFSYDIFAMGELELQSTGLWGLGVAVLANVTISAALVWCFHQGRTGLRKSKSDGIIDRLIMMTVTTGSFTTVVVFAEFVAYLAAPLQSYGVFFSFMLGKLYINTLLTMLNSRTYVRGVSGAAIEINSIQLRVSIACRGDRDGPTPIGASEPLNLTPTGPGTEANTADAA
ncbi:hypothetical protein C8Q77DRAFT_1133824 [Trametes polyzona]|nr:hypothetical protein C8Q77DRAFT_1133824 [Trametes polyzona]